MRDDRLPTGWVSTTLGECYKWSSGGTPLRSNSAYYGGEIPWAVIGDLPDGPISSTSTSITDAGLENSSAKWAEQGSLLVAMYGSIGKLGIARERITTNQAIAFTNPHPVLVSYLFWYLYYQRGQLHARGKGGTQRNISQTVIRSFPFVLAPLPEQHRIVVKLDELFSELDAGVAALERAQAKLKRYRASVLKAAVEGKMTEEWRRNNPPNEMGEELLRRILVERRKRWEEEQLAKFKAKGQKPPKNWQRKYKEPPGPDTTDLPGLPEGWVETDVGSLMSFIQYGHTASAITRATGPRFLRITDIRDSGVDWNTVPSCDLTAEEQEKYRLRPGDLVFARTGATTGKSYLIRTLPDAVFASYLIRLRPTDGIDPAFVYWFFQSPTYWSQISKGKRGVGQPNVNATVLASLRVPVAPSPEQHRIVAILEELFSVVNHLEADINAKLKSAQGLRQSILERAFAGQLVPQDPNDEPASLLLERIRVSREAERPKKSRRSTASTEWIQSP